MTAQSNLELPPPTPDPEEAAAHLIEYGVCRLERALRPGELDVLQRGVCRAQDDDARSSRSYTYSGDANQRVWSLFNRGECFLDLAENRAALRVIRAILGPDAIVSNVSANVAGPGGTAMAPHWDQDWAERPWPQPFVAHVIWMLDDFTALNGATLVRPSSHLLDGPPEDPYLLPATGVAGTALIIDGRTWHGTGANISAGTCRTGILAYYCRPYIRQQENMSLSLAADVSAGMSPGRRKLFGLGFWEYLNMVDGPPPELSRF
jgi:ectoine hydroxylase-related dioxygenase (phytanoyl-CoA dioxygenase family)